MPDSTASSNFSAPRPITARARSQAWSETPVRLWAALALLALLVTLWTGYAKYREGQAERELQTRSRATAEVKDINGGINVQKWPRNEPFMVKLAAKIDGIDGVQTLRGILPPAPGQHLSVGDTIEIRVDPKNLSVFTDQPPAPWLQKLMVPIVMLPIALVMLGVSKLQHIRMLKLYATGALRQATIVDERRAPLTPGARIVKAALAGEGASKRLFAVVRPDRLGPVERGATIDVIVDDPQKPTRALLAGAYDDSSS
ncbi:MAG: hypothetical protein QM770_05740 [Tepidisphaeraceae bacterium]